MIASFYVRSLRARVAPALVCVGLLVPRSSRADPPLDQPIPVRLSYIVPRGSSDCPSEESFRAIVAKHVEGPDPFTGKADEPKIVVQVSRDGSKYKVDLIRQDRAGKREDGIGPIKGETCVKVVEDAGGAVVDILPMRAPVRATAVAPAPKPTERPSRAEIPPDELPQEAPQKPPPVPKWPIERRVGFMLGADVRPGTSWAFGLTADIGFKIARWTLAAQFHAVPSARPTAGGFDTVLLAGGLVACWRFEEKIAGHPVAVPLCVMAEAGQIESGRGGVNPLDRAGFFADGGGRIGIEIPFRERFYFSVEGELLDTVQPGVSGPPIVASAVRGLGGGAHAGGGFTF